MHVKNQEGRASEEVRKDIKANTSACATGFNANIRSQVRKELQMITKVTGSSGAGREQSC
eukprot:346159-Pelagomonas_calceolata.AAC.3